MARYLRKDNKSRKNEFTDRLSHSHVLQRLPMQFLVVVAEDGSVTIPFLS
jgi:hypothetical protein